MYVSLVIPVFNEAKRLPSGLHNALLFLKKQSYSWEIILVNDGSTDASFSKAKNILKNIPTAHILTHEFNQGKGAAIKTGIMNARGRYIIFSDIDFSTPIESIVVFLRALKKQDVVIGIRRHPKSRVLKHQPIARELMGHMFTKLTNVLITPGIYDFTCGFKGFQREAALKIFSQMHLRRWAFDAEALFLARKYGFSVAQLPVIWSNNPATKVDLIKDTVQSFIDLFKIRWLDVLGKYE